jgi:hypothetical protein
MVHPSEQCAVGHTGALCQVYVPLLCRTPVATVLKRMLALLLFFSNQVPIKLQKFNH